jgi:hypothetical protein
MRDGAAWSARARLFAAVALVNLAVFCAAVAVVELSYRTWLFFRNCDNNACHNSSFFTKLDAFHRNKYLGYLAADPIVGYAPTDGAFIIREPGWNDAKVTIAKGVRANGGSPALGRSESILAVGDSFVFGEQLSDDESWPAILERETGRRVTNGGVSGYGPLQAVLRAEQLVRTEAYATVILSILVTEDLRRDRLVHANDLPRPAVIRDNGRIRHTTLAESRDVLSTVVLCRHRWFPEMFFWSHVAKRIFSGFGYDGRCARVVHPNAATIDEILDYVVGRFAALPGEKVLVIQYPRYSFEGVGSDEPMKMREVAGRHGVRVIDTCSSLENEPLDEIYIESVWWPHHSRRGNEVVAKLIARELFAESKETGRRSQQP